MLPRRRNFLRPREWRTLYAARRQGNRYCTACGTYRRSYEITGADPHTCDYCRGARHCRRCRQDRPVAEFGAAGRFAESDHTCRPCQNYRALTEAEHAAITTFLATQPSPAPPPADDGVSLGHDDTGHPVHLPAALRRRHLYLIGVPGSGKTALMKHLMIQDMAAGRGCAFLNTRGDTAMELLGSVPPTRRAAVTYFAPATGHGPTFDPLALPYPPHVVTEGMVSVFEMFFGDTWGPQLQQVLRFGVLTLLGDRAPHTLADLYTFYTAPLYRESIVSASPSPRLRAFWQHEFPAVERGVIDLVTGKLGAFLTPLSPLESLLSTPHNALDCEAVLNGGQILIADLSRRALGDEPARLVGSLLLMALTEAARQQPERPPGDRPDFHLYLPACHDYATAGLRTILTAADTEGLHLTFSHDRLSQLPADLRDTIFNGVGTIAAFQVASDDAVQLTRVMHARRLAHGATGRLYDHDAARRAAALPVVARARALLAARRTFESEDRPTYPGSQVDELLADIDRVRALPLPGDAVDIRWPRSMDLEDLEPGSAVVALGSPDDVTAFRVEAPPPPDPALRDKILSRPRRRLLPERVEANNAPRQHARDDAMRASQPRRWRRGIRRFRRPPR